MKITHVVENLNRGGLERMVIELASLQRQHGHECQIVSLFEPGLLADEARALGIPVSACHKGAGPDLRALLRLRRRIDGFATDVLHTHNAVAHYYAVAAACGLGVDRVINTRHSMLGARRPANTQHEASARQLAGRREWLYRRALANTDAIATVCDAARRDAVRDGLAPSAKTIVVPNGISLTGVVSGTDASRARLRQSLGLLPQVRLLGTVGRLSWAKDQATLIRAFAQVQRQRPDTVLVLVGSGELDAELRQCAAAEGVLEQVRFLGDRNDVPALLAGFDLFALSSVSEGYSMALLEACAASLPMVATDVGGNGEIVRDGTTGRLVPAADAQALAEALLALLDNPQQAAALASAARSWVEAEGTLDVMAKRYEAIYRGAPV